MSAGYDPLVVALRINTIVFIVLWIGINDLA
jgi:hypothetical protein